jgi:DNA polymerase I
MSAQPLIPKDPLILVDGSSYLFRAYHALPPLSTRTGQPTGAIVGVINMLKKLINHYNPSKIAVVFDAKGKNFRHALYAAYKAHRAVMPEDLAVQIDPLKAVIEAMGLTLITVPGVEADDVIGTLAFQAKAHDQCVLIASGDKDFVQLIDPLLFVVNTMTDQVLDEQAVFQKFEIRPNQMVDYLTLIGDTVDNIPGVPSVGPKTAVKWLKSHETLENIIKHATEISGKVGESLRATVPQLPLFKRLVTIQTDVALDYTMNDCLLKKPDHETLEQLLTELECTHLLKHVSMFQEDTKEAQAACTKDYETILSQEHFEQWLQRLEKAELFSFDTETNSLDYMVAEIIGLSFAITAYQAAYVPLMHDYEGAPVQLDREAVLERLRPLLENEAKAKVGHNLKYDKEVLANHGITLRGLRFDTMLESYVLGSTLSRHSLAMLSKKYLQAETISFEDLAGKGKKQLTFNQIEIEKAAFYAAEDADLTLQLHHHFWPRLQASQLEKKVFEQIEMPLVPVLVAMERGGVLVDTAVLARQAVDLEKQLQGYADRIYTLAGKDFNIDSPLQLQSVLYEDLKLPIFQKTPGGQPSTAEAVLERLAENFELPGIVLHYRSLSKLLSTYVHRLPEQMNVKTGRVHTSYHQAVTGTGRLSSSNPNLQNIPIRTPEGRKIRSAFIAPSGYKIVSADYSQIELRILAHLSQDPGLLEAFSLGDDIHRNTAAAVWNVPLEAVTPEQRRSAKAINFGLMYGMSAFGLSKQLGIPLDAAQLQVDRYFECFSGVKQFMAQVVAEGVAQGYVQTIKGRRLYLPDLKSSNVSARRAAERAAVNAPMQGSNADIIKLAMIELYRVIQDKPESIRMIMQVHDELVFEVLDADVPQATEQIRRIMEGVCTLSVPLKVDIGVGNNWDEAH